jgi:competence protein ComEA
MEKRAIGVLIAMCLATACEDHMPVVATYVPANCPTIQPADTEPREPAVVPRFAFVGPTQAPAISPLDLNVATAEELDRLPGVGPAMAGRILEYRERRAFRRVRDLRRVRGIGPATFAKLRKLVIVQKRKP